MDFSNNGGGNGLYMPVAPAYGGNNNGGFGGDWGWIILLLLCGWGGGMGFGGGFGGWGGMANWDTMWLLNGQNNTNNNVNSGFRDALLNDGISSIGDKVMSGFGDVQTSLCSGFAGVNATVNAVGNGITQQLYNGTIADMERSFAVQSALQNCCCENRAATADLKYTVATENCADRAAIADGIRDVIASNTASTQRILDQLCQDKIDAKNDEIAQLRQEVLFARGQASQIAQNQQVIDGIYNRLDSCPVGTTPVFGRTAIFSCNNNGCGCGCNGNL